MKKKGVAVLLIWWIVWCTLHIMVLSNFGLNFLQATVDAIVSNVLIVAACVLVISNMKYYLPKHEKYWYVLIISTTLSLLWLLLIRICLWALYKNDTAYLLSLSQSSIIRLVLAFLVIACCTTLSLLWYTQKNEQADYNRKKDMEQLAKDAELNKLRQQLQPHFLFNSLNSISALTGSQPDKARVMIQQLADFLRSTLKKENQQWATLDEELQYLQLYLDIEKVRFGYRLKTEINYDELTINMKLPTLLLQPIVENAIKFGLYDTIGEVTISLSATVEQGMLQVQVQNPFDENTSVTSNGMGFGLSSVKRRLILLFARYDLLQTKKDASQFITIINIPQLI